LTLARSGQPAPLTAIQQAIAKLESVEFGMFEATRFYLYRSHTGPAGAVYTKLSEIRFAA
jgi:2'-5' RNA ligase